MLSPIPRRNRGVHISLSSPTMAAFPDFWAGRLPHCVFRGLLSVHSRYGLHTRQVTYMTLYTGGFSRFVTSAAAPIATGWSDLAGRDSHPLRNRAFARRTKICTLAFMAAVRARVLPANLPETGLFRHIRMPYFAHRLQFHFYEQETLGATGHSRHFIDRLCARDQERNRETSRAETPNRIRGRSQGVFPRAEVRHVTTRSRVLSSTERSLFPTDVLHSGSAKCVRRYCENWGREGTLVLQQVQRLRGF